MDLKAAIFFIALALPLNDAVAALRSSELEEHKEHRQLATCGNGNRGDGACAGGLCCSEWGWCGTGTSHCGSGGGSGGLKGDWELCAASSECANGCCSNVYSDDGKLKCTPGGYNCVSSSTPTRATCGNGNRGDGACAGGLCCSEWGWCGTGTSYCGSDGSSGGLKGDWELCAASSECSNGCCSSAYSDDGKLKCTPGGYNCVLGGGGGGGGGITSPPKTLTVADLQVALDKYAQLQGGSLSASQDSVNKLNSATTGSGWSLYRQVAFTAHAIWESGGLRYTEEQAAVEWPFAAKDDYQLCAWGDEGSAATNGKFFYGRGYMQLSWCANYLAYGRARMINNDPNYFYNNPELVATQYAWDSAAWFFTADVDDTSGRFGLTTSDINGDIECKSSNNWVGSAPQKRYQIFVALADQVGLTGYSEGGCYN